jgi:type VI secretion system protein ImpM
MPSVDGVGRYYPLCVLGAFDEPVPPPEIDDQAEWFAPVEALLLAALDEEGTYAALIAGLESLPPPRSAPPPSQGGTGVREAFAALRAQATGGFYERCTCWWVPSPDGVRPPRTLLRRGFPSPADFATMVALDGDVGLLPEHHEPTGEAP